jgi:hypothetical protein
MRRRTLSGVLVPFQANALNAVWIAAVALVISAAATLIPACAASRILPVDILYSLVRVTTRVSGNWRLTFAFAGEDAILVDCRDYH